MFDGFCSFDISLLYFCSSINLTFLNLMIKEITPNDAFLALKSGNSVLVDVRTDAEFAFVGQVNLDSIDSSAILLPWKIFPAMAINPRFQISLEKILQERYKERCKEISLIFMCRSGARSYEAASYMASFGYNCCNLINGFEGDLDSFSKRGNINGWKAMNLPWRQQ